MTDDFEEREKDFSQSWPFERVCAECGKTFCVRNVDEYAYKYRHKMLCCYSCKRKMEIRIEGKSTEAERQARKNLKPAVKEALIRRLVMRGLSNDEISKQTGFSRQLVNHYRRKMEDETV